MMRHSYIAKAMRLTQSLEPVVAQTTRRHFDAFARALRLLFRVEMFYEKADTQFLAQVSDELFVAVAFFAPQMKIAVRCSLRFAPFVHHEQQRHRIGPAA